MTAICDLTASGNAKLPGGCNCSASQSIETDAAEMLGARSRDTPGETVDECEIVWTEVAGPGAIPENCGNRCEQKGTQDMPADAGLPAACEVHRRVSPAIFAPG
jgi:hypothetical protein